MYLWALLGRDLRVLPILNGTSGDLAVAMRETEPMVKDGRAFVAAVEEVRLRISVAGLEDSYVSTGRCWVGRRTNSGGVHWITRSGPPDPSVIYRIPGGVDAAMLAEFQQLTEHQP